jgi:hypothetical protein
LRRRDEVSGGNGDSAQIVNNCVDIVAKLSRDGNDWSTFCDCALDEVFDVLMLLDASLWLVNDDVNLVLQDDDLV